MVLAGMFMLHYGVDPANARASGGGSVGTRSKVYGDTVNAVTDYRIVTGYGTELPRLVRPEDPSPSFWSIYLKMWAGPRPLPATDAEQK